MENKNFAFLFAISLTELFGAAAMSQEKPPQTIIDQSVTSHNQSGGITAHTVNVGPQRLKFETAIAEELVRKLPQGKPVRLRSVGSNTDHAIASEYQEFLTRRGFDVTRDVIGMLMPPPENKITIDDRGPQIVVIIAPSAN
jgi:hypothetical protein